MINFAAFAKKKEQEILNPIPVMNNTHGSHANRPTIPNLYIQHGSHSKKQLFEKDLSNYAGNSGSVIDWISKPSNEHLGDSKKDKDQYLENHHADSFDDLNDKERKAIKDYTSYSHDLNINLDNKEDKSDDHLENHFKIHANLLDSSIKKHKLPKMTLYSGIGFDPAEKTKDSNGVFKSSAYTSTSFDKETAHGFSEGILNTETRSREYHVLRINVPDNHHGIYVGRAKGPRDLTDSTEHEVLLPRDLHYKITGRKTYTDTSSNSRERTHVWNAHIVPKGENPHTWKPE